MKTTEFVFVRHGETDANVNGILQGNKDIPLNRTGMMQAEAVAEHLRGQKFAALYASDLSRALDTARLIASKHADDLPLYPTPLLREWNCGEMAGMRWEEIQRRFPNEAKAFFLESADVTMPGGESRTAFQHRVEDCLRQIVAKHGGERVLLVAHGGVLQRIFRFVAGVISERNLIPFAGNASISTFIHRDDLDAWQLTSWNRVSHLKDLPQHLTRVL